MLPPSLGCGEPDVAPTKVKQIGPFLVLDGSGSPGQESSRSQRLVQPPPEAHTGVRGTVPSSEADAARSGQILPVTLLCSLVILSELCFSLGVCITQLSHYREGQAHS